MAASDITEQQRSFTSQKLDWMTGLSGDKRVNATAFEIGFTIAQCVNQTTGKAILSDQGIADRTGIHGRRVRQERSLLKATGWLMWKRTRNSNHYSLLFDNINRIADEQIVLSDARRERRLVSRIHRPERLPSAYLTNRERLPSAGLDRSASAARERLPSADIHLQGNTVSLSPSKEGAIQETDRDSGRAGLKGWGPKAQKRSNGI